MAQTRSRLAGQLPDSAARLVSLHDPHARSIRKGRIDRPVEFGFKAQVADNDGGVVLDYSVEYGAAPDGPQRIARGPRRRVRSAPASAGRAAGTRLPGGEKLLTPPRDPVEVAPLRTSLPFALMVCGS